MERKSQPGKRRESKEEIQKAEKSCKGKNKENSFAGHNCICHFQLEDMYHMTGHEVHDSTKSPSSEATKELESTHQLDHFIYSSTRSFHLTATFYQFIICCTPFV